MNRFFKRFILVVLACFLATGAFAGNGIQVKATKGFNTDFEVKFTDVSVDKTQILGRNALAIIAQNAHQMFEKDCPELPFLSALVMIDPLRVPVIKVDPIQTEIITLDAPVVPSRGQITRAVDPSSVPYKYGEIYTKDQWYPSDENIVKLDSPFIFRNVRGTRLAIFPVQYNPVQNKIRIHRALKITLSSGEAEDKNVVRAPLAISSYFEPMYKQLFINFKNVAERLPRLDEKGRVLVICYDAFVDAIQPLVAWKTKCGIQVTVAKTSEAGKTAAEIKAFIQADYNKGGLTNILLVGDAEQVPTLKGVKENADSDPCYTKLAGDDHVPDCIISRFSASTVEQVAYQVAKTINYEQFPSTGANASWYKKGSGIASAEGNPTDYVRAGWLKEPLVKFGFAIDEIYDPGATKAKVAAAVNEGRTLINYIGHGSNTTWGTTGFSNADCALLKNGWKMPIIWSVACVNGNFVGKECFAEAWMKAGTVDAPRGAVAIYAATTNMEWVPPCDVQKEIVTNYTVNELYKTIGGLAMNGIMKGLEIYGVDPKGSGVMMFEQWHLFGDGTLLVRFKEPQAITATIESASNDTGSKVSVKVTNAEGKPVANARVTVYTTRYETVQTTNTNDEGIAVVNSKVAKSTDGFITVVGSDLVPVVDQKFSF